MSIFQATATGKIIQKDGVIVNALGGVCACCACRSDHLQLVIAGATWNGSSAGLGITIASLNVNGTYTFTWGLDDSNRRYWYADSDYIVGADSGANPIYLFVDTSMDYIDCDDRLYKPEQMFLCEFGPRDVIGAALPNSLYPTNPGAGTAAIYGGTATVTIL